MKNIITTLLFAIISIVSFSQNPDSLFIYKSVDDMTDKTIYFASKRVICMDEVNNIGFGITFFINGKNDTTLTTSDLSVKTIGYGCLENVEVIFLFEDGSKVTCNSWNKFNCDGVAYCTVSKSDKEIMATKKLQKIRVVNKRNYKVYTGVVDEGSQDYFILLFQAIQSKKVIPYKGKK